MTAEAQAPILYGRREGVHLIVWCDECRREHFHGICSGDPACPALASFGRRACTCPKGSGDGHRIAHCPTGRYRATGYYIVER
jgi:hypothetical protein